MESANEQPITAAALARQILTASGWDSVSDPADPIHCLQRIQAICLKVLESTDQPAVAPAADDMERNTDESLSGIPPVG